IAFGDALGPVAHFGDHQFGGVGVDDLVDGRHHAHAHQRLDHVGAALGHALRQLLHGDDLGDGDLAIDLLLRHVVGMLAAALAFETALLLGARTGAEIVLALHGTADVDLVGAALGRLAARAGRLRQALVDRHLRPHRRTAQHAAGSAAAGRAHRRTGDARAGWRRAGLDLLGLARGHRRLLRDGCLVEPLLHQRVGLAPRLLVGLLARLFLGETLLVLLVGAAPHFIFGGAALGLLAGALARHFGIAIG